ncbi:tyrosine-type recombinase/integrase [Nocardia thraciensis]
MTTILSQHIAEHCAGEGPGRWLFLNGDTGNPVHQNWVDYRIRKAKKKSGQADAEWTLHDLRHFYASGLIADGCDVVTVQKMLGHKSATETLNTYAHLWPNSNDRARTASASLHRQVFGATAYPLRTVADK